MPPVRFETAVPASDMPQILAFDLSASGLFMTDPQFPITQVSQTQILRWVTGEVTLLFQISSFRRPS